MKWVGWIGFIWLIIGAAFLFSATSITGHVVQPVQSDNGSIWVLGVLIVSSLIAVKVIRTRT